MIIDALYLIGNTFTFYAACSYYTTEDQGILLTALLSSIFGVVYGLGVLRLFRWGLDLESRYILPIVYSYLLLAMPWSVYRSIMVQDEYTLSTFNPINASLSFQWKQIPQVSVFADVYYLNDKKD